MCHVFVGQPRPSGRAPFALSLFFTGAAVGVPGCQKSPFGPLPMPQSDSHAFTKQIMGSLLGEAVRRMLARRWILVPDA